MKKNKNFNWFESTLKLNYDAHLGEICKDARCNFKFLLNFICMINFWVKSLDAPNAAAFPFDRESEVAI